MATCRLRIPPLPNHRAAPAWRCCGNSRGRAGLVPLLRALLGPRCEYKAHLLQFKRSMWRKPQSLEESKEVCFKKDAGV